MKNFKKVYFDLQKYFLGTKEFSLFDPTFNDCYPIDLEFTLEKESFYYSPKDVDGIPCKVYTSVGEHYNPTRIAAYGLANFNRYLLENKKESKEKFIKCANWFLSKKSAKYEYLFNWGPLKSPWISCMSQGEAASVLVRAYILTKKISYLSHAEKSLEPFFYSIASGGVQSTLNDGSIFLEEYPSKWPSHVLNGFMYALIGLSDYIDISKSKKHQLLFDKLIFSLDKNIHLWVHGKWTLYDDPSCSGGKNFCTPSYHNLQITQLTWLANRTNSIKIKVFTNSLKNGLSSLSTRLFALVGKIYYRLRFKAQR